MTTVKTTPIAAPAPGDAPVVDVSETRATALEEPTAGGNYVRDPVTGALSLNPSHLNTTSPLE